MGFYINEDAPKTCCQCKLVAYHAETVWNDNGRETKGAWICLKTGELIDNTKREEHCPIIPVPEHGPLIDARALSRTLFLASDGEYDPEKDPDSWPNSMRLKDIKRIIAEAPVVIPADREEKA